MRLCAQLCNNCNCVCTFFAHTHAASLARRVRVVTTCLESVFAVFVGGVILPTWPFEEVGRSKFRTFWCLGTCSGSERAQCRPPKRPRSLQHDRSGTQPPPAATHTLTHTDPLISMTMLCCRGVSMVRLGM